MTALTQYIKRVLCGSVQIFQLHMGRGAVDKQEARFGAVLIVEDQPDYWRMIRRDLLQSGLFSSVEVARSLFEAEKLFKDAEEPFTAILMDACLCGEKPDTLELSSEMRRKFYGPIVAMSRDSQFRRIQMQHGCDLEAEKETAASVLIKYLTERGSSAR